MVHLYQHPKGHVFYRAMKHPRPKIAYGEGIYLYDESGKRYLDGSGGPFVVNVGHGRKEVVQAMSEQAQSVAYVHANMFTSGALEDYDENGKRDIGSTKPRKIWDEYYEAAKNRELQDFSQNKVVGWFEW